MYYKSCDESKSVVTIKHLRVSHTAFYQKWKSFRFILTEGIYMWKYYYCVYCVYVTRIINVHTYIFTIQSLGIIYEMSMYVCKNAIIMIKNLLICISADAHDKLK